MGGLVTVFILVITSGLEPILILIGACDVQLIEYNFWIGTTFIVYSPFIFILETASGLSCHGVVALRCPVLMIWVNICG